MRPDSHEVGEEPRVGRMKDESAVESSSKGGRDIWERVRDRYGGVGGGLLCCERLGDPDCLFGIGAGSRARSASGLRSAESLREDGRQLREVGVEVARLARSASAALGARPAATRDLGGGVTRVDLGAGAVRLGRIRSF